MSEEYQLAIRVLQALGLGYGKDEDPYELAQPVNATSVNNHPVLLEMMKPIVTNEHFQTVPRMNVVALGEIVQEGIDTGFIAADIGVSILKLAERYQINAEQAARQVQATNKIVH